MENLNDDPTRRVVMDTAAMEWQPSPSPTVWRKRLDLIGGEHGRVTSVVRYDPNSSFPAHDHPEGEEILVLQGVFADEHGTYPAGTYLLNPPGFRHAPFSQEGCVLFVKLRQYGGADRVHLEIDTRQGRWLDTETSGITRMPLYEHPIHRDRMWLERWRAGARQPAHAHPEGEELFVLEGEMADEHGRYGAGSWVRNPAGSRHEPWSSAGCLLYVKTGGLAGR